MLFSNSNAIGNVMNNLANSYYFLERHNDALMMRENVLKLRRRYLPENHPLLGEHDCVLTDSLIECDALFHR
jgi:hypothetical protein